jgi:hypothetical protein
MGLIELMIERYNPGPTKRASATGPLGRGLGYICGFRCHASVYPVGGRYIVVNESGISPLPPVAAVG